MKTKYQDYNYYIILFLELLPDIVVTLYYVTATISKPEVHHHLLSKTRHTQIRSQIVSESLIF